MSAPDGGTYAFLCETCNGRSTWRLQRQGDVVTTWTCAEPSHLTAALARLQRSHEVTKVLVWHETPEIDAP